MGWLIPLAITVGLIALMAKITYDGNGPDGAAALMFVFSVSVVVIPAAWAIWGLIVWLT